jgi:hypothetical protein
VWREVAQDLPQLTPPSANFWRYCFLDQLSPLRHAVSMIIQPPVLPRLTIRFHPLVPPGLLMSIDAADWNPNRHLGNAASGAPRKVYSDNELRRVFSFFFFFSKHQHQHPQLRFMILRFADVYMYVCMYALRPTTCTHMQGISGFALEYR